MCAVSRWLGRLMAINTPTLLSAAMAKAIADALREYGETDTPTYYALRDLAAGRTVCVPREPTKEMLEAWLHESARQPVQLVALGPSRWRVEMANCYRAMILAAQSKEQT